MKQKVTFSKILALMLIALSVINSSEAVEVARATILPSPMKISSPLLEILDGQVDVTAITLIGAKFYALQHGQGLEKKGLIPFKQGMYTLEEMVEIEHDLGPQKRSNPTIKSEYTHIKKALETTIAESLKISKIYKELRSPTHKDYLVSIIEQWLRQRKKESTLLKSWAKLGEHHFATSIQSFGMLKSFIDDLQVFLRDIKQSCPKSTEFFETELKKRQQGQI